MEDDLNAWELVRVVAEEEEAIVIIQMLSQKFHDCINYHFDDIALFYQLPGLKEEQEYKHTAKISFKENNLL